ncbi:O-antigen ligase family protein [Thermogutta sp.]|uniref:O-antigen ligase family protein n=1 Tax=Thermogutta sp. TaxID=1962930 RepID=UPI003C79E84A
MVIAALVLVGPFAEGATSPVWLSALQVGAAVAGFLGLLSFGTRVRFLWLPMAVLVVGLIQTWPLPGKLVKAVSPASYHAWSFASNCLDRPLSPRLSLAPAATQLAIRQLFLAALVFAITAELARDRRKALFLGGTLASVGGVVLAWGCAEWLFRHDVITSPSALRWPFGYKNPLVDPLRSAAFGRVQTLQVGGVSLALPFWVLGDGFGPYLVSNHFGGCLELTIPVLFSLLCLKRKRHTPAVSLVRAALGILAVLIAVTAVTVLALGASARAATAGVLLGCTWVAWQRSTGIWRRLGGAVFCLEVLCYLGLFILSASGEVLAHRAGDDGTTNTLALIGMWIGGAQWRISQWAVCWRMFLASPITGIGMGSYRFASPFYTDSEVVTAFAHADYLQFLAEGGLLGVTVLTIFLAHFLKSVTIRSFTRDSVENPLLVGLCGGLVAFLPHGFVDWNLHIPANALLFVVALGLVVGLAGRESVRRVSDKSIVSFTKLGITVIVPIFCIAVIIGVIRYARAERSLEPLRHALLFSMDPKAEIPSAEKTTLLLNALPSALEAARGTSASAETPLLIGLAHLYVSQGKPGPELRLAEEAFGQAVAATPLRVDLCRTLAELRFLLTTCERNDVDHSAK